MLDVIMGFRAMGELLFWRIFVKFLPFCEALLFIISLRRAWTLLYRFDSMITSAEKKRKRKERKERKNEIISDRCETSDLPRTLNKPQQLFT